MVFIFTCFLLLRITSINVYIEVHTLLDFLLVIACLSRITVLHMVLCGQKQTKSDSSHCPFFLIFTLHYYILQRNGENQFFFERVTAGNESALIFINNALLPAFVAAIELQMDATFKTPPRGFISWEPFMLYHMVILCFSHHFL